MQGTSARLLALLGLLQTRDVWAGAELADRLDVGERTLRNDIGRLRDLGYPITSARGTDGGYRLGRNGRLPPLLLGDDEAVAVAVGLHAAAALPGLGQISAEASVKLEQLLPEALRRRVAAVRDASEAGPDNTRTNEAPPEVDPSLLAEVATAVRDREALRVRIGAKDGERLVVEPHRLVSWQGRWYVVARARPGGEWRALRFDRLEVASARAGRFSARPLEGGEYAAFVVREVARTGWAVHARIEVDAPASEVVARINPAVGVVEEVDAERCALLTGADTLETVAVWIGMLGLPFHVQEPPALVEHVRTLAERYRDALPCPEASRTG